MDPADLPAELGPPLAAWLPERRWFQGKARTITGVRVADAVRLDGGVLDVLADVEYSRGASERYQIPLVPGRGRDGLRVGGVTLVDALTDPQACGALVEAVTRARQWDTARGGRVVGLPVTGEAPGPGDHPRLLRAEQSNSSVVFGDRFILKVLRRLQSGVHPDVEVTRALTEAGFAHVPAQHGAAELQAGGETTALAVLSAFVAGGQEGWQLATEDADAFLAHAGDLGAATARMHEALGQLFGVRPPDGGRAWAEDMLAQLDTVLETAAERAPEAAAEVLERADAIRDIFAALGEQTDVGPLIRVHGDFHLGQVLLAPDGAWQLLDFEGEPAKPLEQRRARSSPLRDVAGMLRSFDYAAATAGGGADAQRWRAEARQRYLDGYDRTDTGLLPPAHDRLLAAFELDKAVYELGYELANRPTWAPIAVGGILDIVGCGRA